MSTNPILSELLRNQRQLWRTVNHVLAQHSLRVQETHVLTVQLAEVESKAEAYRQEARQEYEDTCSQLSVAIQNTIFSTKSKKEEERAEQEKQAQNFVAKLRAEAQASHSDWAKQIDDINRLRYEMRTVISEEIPTISKGVAFTVYTLIVISFFAGLGALFGGGVVLGIVAVSIFMIAYIWAKNYDKSFLSERHHALM